MPDEAAEVRMTALMIEGRALIPASWMEMTHGEADALFEAFRRSGLSYGTKTPIASDPST